MRSTPITAAVVAALSLGGSGMAYAGGPTPAAAASAMHRIYIAGSSAAADGIFAYFENTVFGGSYSVFTTPTGVGQGDFRAVSGFAVPGQPFAGTTVTVWFRAEGGSVVGVLPVINNVAVKQLDIANAGCTITSSNVATAAYTCTHVNGTSTANASNDSWSGGVFLHTIDIGVSDLEPGVFGNLNGPTKAWAGFGAHDAFGTYAPSFTGLDANVDQLQAMTHDIVFQQTFGFVASSNLNITDLPYNQIAAIFDGLVSNWNQVSRANNTPVGSGPIVVCNREVGSGPRAAADVFLNLYGCNLVGAVNPLVSSGTPADNFQTLTELDCVNSHSGAIGYVSVDNFAQVGTTFPNVVALSVSENVANTQNSGTGVYSDVYESSLNKNIHASPDGALIYPTLVRILQDRNTTSNDTQITAIPYFLSNLPLRPLQTGALANVVTSDFTRGAAVGGNSCTPLTW